MRHEDIQTANPGGVRDRPGRMAEDKPRWNVDGVPPVPDLRRPLPEKNVPALLSLLCGLLALLFALREYGVACDGPRWLTRVLEFGPAGTETAILLAMAGLLLGVFGIVERFWYPTAGGLLRALGGIAASSLALFTLLETFVVRASHWS